jgi:hypothetical protein
MSLTPHIYHSNVHLILETCPTSSSTSLPLSCAPNTWHLLAVTPQELLLLNCQALCPKEALLSSPWSSDYLRLELPRLQLCFIDGDVL